MKFGHQYQERLKEGFPHEWVQSAISYRQLKKCIKKLQKELAELGLNAETLKSLLQAVEKRNEDLVEERDPSSEAESPFQYELSEEPGTPGVGTTTAGNYFGSQNYAARITRFHPKLIFAVDEETGGPLDIRLSPETRTHLHQAALLQGLTDVRITEERRESAPSIDAPFSVPDASDLPQAHALSGGRRPSSVSTENSEGLVTLGRRTRKIEISLTSDSEFFNQLKEELTGLRKLQDQEQERLSNQIKDLGIALKQIVESRSNKASKRDLDMWRRIFEMYIDSRIFFSTNEQDHGAYGFAKARDHLQQFSNRLIAQEDVLTKFKRKESAQALSQFLKINAELLQSIHFQELNQTAMTKILKKFDKRTSLNASLTFPSTPAASSIQKTIAKAICYEMHNKLLPIVPQLADHQCAICTSIYWRPIKLTCGHIFCIRCIIVLQRNKTEKCPFCREPTVMEADATHMDAELMKFLRTHFPTEVKAKQKDNERLAGIDEYGEAYGKAYDMNERCTVM